MSHGTPSPSRHISCYNSVTSKRRRRSVYEQDDVLEDLQHIVDLHFQGRDPAAACACLQNLPASLNNKPSLTGTAPFDNAARKELEQGPADWLSVQPVFLLREIYLSKERRRGSGLQSFK